MNWPDPDNDSLLPVITEILDRALSSFEEMREKEGRKLTEDILSRVQSIERLLDGIEGEYSSIESEYKARLEKKLREVLDTSDLDDGRILTEVAIFADKTAIDEETVRLRSHIAQLRKIISESGPVGRKLDFLVQELNREANTIGSKCQNSSVAHLVVELKSEIEKIREQIQNVE